MSGKLNNLQKADMEENIVSCNVLEASSPIAKGISTAIRINNIGKIMIAKVD